MLTPNARSGSSRWRATLAIAGLSVLLASCTAEPKGGPRIVVIPAEGEVLVDGEPAYDAIVVFHPNTPHHIPAGGTAAHSQGQVDAEGKFVVSTYERGDGLPVGEYKVSITWHERSGMSMRDYGGPDRLKGKYKDPETTGFTLTVSEGEETLSIPRFELTLKEE